MWTVRGMYIVAALCAACALAGAGELDDAYGLLVAESVPADGYVATDVDFSALQQALGRESVSSRLDPPRALLEMGGELRPLTVQSDITPGNQRLTILLPPDAPQPARIRLHFMGGEPEDAPKPPEPSATVSVRKDVDRVIVDNGCVEVVHDPKIQSGLPSKVMFRASNKTLEGFFLNDRVHDLKTGSFFLRTDPEAAVKILRVGPLEAAVEVSARYMQGVQTPPSNPRATYVFSYRAGSPAVEVTADCAQDAPFLWHELHLIEWNMPGRPLPYWSKGMPAESGLFEKDDESILVGQWACLTDQTDTIGVICANPKLYSGNGGYGSYVHGPWVSWDSAETRLACTLWLDGQPGAADRLAAHSPAPARIYVTTPGIDRQRLLVAARLDGMAPGQVRGLHRWWFAMTDRVLKNRGGLIEARASLTEQARLLDSSADADGILKAIRARVEKAGRILLANGDVMLVLGSEAEGRSPVSFYSLAEERELLSGLVQPWWTLSMEDDAGQASDWSNLSSGAICAVDTRPDGALLTWTGQGLSAKLDVSLDGRQVRTKLAVDNASEGLSILRVRFPELSLSSIGGDPGDDVYLSPQASGVIAKAPLLTAFQTNATYPSGWGSLQCSAYYDPDCGLYVAAHDPVGSLKEFKAKRAENVAAIVSSIEWPAADASRMGNDFNPPGEVVMAAFKGDWYDVAQIYRAWASEEAQWWPKRGEWGRPDTADWVKDICVWALDNGSADGLVPRVKKFAEFMGTPTALHWYNWHQIPFDDNYPHYFPVKDGFAEGVAQLQAAGVRVMPYINGRLWDSDTDDFQTVALPAATKDRKGDYYIEVYGSGQNLVPMCPTQTVWRDKVQEIVLRLMSPECNVDGVYIDQIAAAGPRECYDASHGHPLCGGHWWTTDGYWPMLEKLNRSVDERNDGKFLTTECNAEPYLHLMDGYLTWHFQYNGAVPLFAAIYGGKIQMFSRAYNGNDQLAHRMKMGQSLVFGEQLGWINPVIVDEHPDTAAYLRRCARMRQKLRAYLACGYMARPPQVTGDIPDVTADWAWSGEWPVTDSALQRAAWRAEDGSVAFVFANTTENPLPFVWHFDAAQYGLAATGLQIRELTEDTESDPAACEGVFDRDVTLDPVMVKAFIVRGM